MVYNLHCLLCNSHITCYIAKMWFNLICLLCNNNITCYTAKDVIYQLVCSMLYSIKCSNTYMMYSIHLDGWQTQYHMGYHIITILHTISFVLHRYHMYDIYYIMRYMNHSIWYQSMILQYDIAMMRYSTAYITGNKLLFAAYFSAR